ncbi:hypothetical protein OE88DRAFT_1120379 [Heliocybe sulcata]|uniref:MYND-type domain-containing protein n=1 Tax=Heliocybe sulcata TaxID=5364 RepID=A0A5C3MNC6_9AGAM|nr:hypothetical protein OE88DRAFT_1120379 [Heliocybe sulcata]
MSDLPELQLTIFEYGFGGRRVEIDVRPKVPSRDILGNMQMIHDHRWQCEFCGEPARETSYAVASWLHLSPPRLNVYVHHVCDPDNPPCKARLEAAQSEMARLTRQPAPPGGGYLPRTNGAVFPLAASCACCKEDSTAGNNNGQMLRRCSRCKLTRYCGVKCQSEDWPRHKSVCKTIRNVNWVEF